MYSNSIERVNYFPSSFINIIVRDFVEVRWRQFKELKTETHFMFDPIDSPSI